MKTRKLKKYDPTDYGVTQSLLSSFLACRQKCRIYLDGWTSTGIKHGMTFGTISHGCLELAYDDIMKGNIKGIPSKKQVISYIDPVLEKWRKENPRAGKQGAEVLEYCATLAEAVLPAYFEYWEKDIKNLKWVELEGTFKIPYEIKNPKYKGIIIPIRGRKDGQFQYTNSKGLWLFETKNLSRIEEDTLIECLPLNLQVNTYLLALLIESGQYPAGVLYNIVRRPGLRQSKKESIVQFAKRCADDVLARPEFYFIRLEIKMTEEDIDTFQKEFDGLLSDFYGWCIGDNPHYKNSGSCQNKYGRCEFLNICSSSDYSNVAKRKIIFKELEDL